MIKSSPEGTYDTDADRWRCKVGPVCSKWYLSNSYDSDWPKAEFLGFNGDCLYSKGFFAGCIQMSEYASWIWYPSTTDSEFYCRLS